MKGTQLTVADFEGRERKTKECGHSLEAMNDPQLTARKETGTSVLQQQGSEFCH